MKYILFVIFIIILYLFKRYYYTYKYFTLCKKLSIQKNKKLIVIGDPCVGGFFKFFSLFNRYGHGDVTIDLYGCDKCLKLDINNILTFKRFETNRYVVFETATLCFCKNMKETIHEIKRISGGDFYSSGGTNHIFWKYIGNKLYSKRYPNSLTCMTYPYNPSMDCFKTYHFEKKKYIYY